MLRSLPSLPRLKSVFLYGHIIIYFLIFAKMLSSIEGVRKTAQKQPMYSAMKGRKRVLTNENGCFS